MFPSPSIICIGLGIKILPLVVRFIGGLLGYSLNFMGVRHGVRSLRYYRRVVFSGSM